MYKQLIQREQQRLASRRIKYTLGKLQSSSVTRVEVPLQNGQWKEITTKDGIESACMEENERKYRQTEYTPCMREPLRTELGTDGRTKAGEKILEGTYQCPTGTNIYTQEFFTALKREDNMIHEAPEETVSTDDYRNG